MSATMERILRNAAPIDTCHSCKGSGRFVTWAGRDHGPCFGCNGTGTPKRPRGDQYTTSKHIDTQQLVALCGAFASASEHLKKPKLHIGDVTIKLAPASGRNPGALYITLHGEYAGKVTSGVLHALSWVQGVDLETITNVLQSPHDAAINHGKLTGSCACCGRELSDPKSITKGIGPVCAKRWGW